MGTVKRTKVSEFQNIRRSGLIALTLRDGDELNNVLTTDGKQNILIGTHLGYAVTFNEKMFVRWEEQRLVSVESI